MNTGERIKEIRQKIGLTQTKFATRIAISVSYLAEIERGSKLANERVIRLLVLEFKIDERWLKTGHGSMFSDGHDAKTAKVISLINSLNPPFQDYAIRQLEELVQLSASLVSHGNHCE